VRIGKIKNKYRILTANPLGRRPLERLGRIMEDNIQMDLREVGFEDGRYTELSQDRVRWQTSNVESLGFATTELVGWLVG